MLCFLKFQCSSTGANVQKGIKNVHEKEKKSRVDSCNSCVILTKAMTFMTIDIKYLQKHLFMIL